MNKGKKTVKTGIISMSNASAEIGPSDLFPSYDSIIPKNVLFSTFIEGVMDQSINLDHHPEFLAFVGDVGGRYAVHLKDHCKAGYFPAAMIASLKKRKSSIAPTVKTKKPKNRASNFNGGKADEDDEEEDRTTIDDQQLISFEVKPEIYFGEVVKGSAEFKKLYKTLFDEGAASLQTKKDTLCWAIDRDEIEKVTFRDPSIMDKFKKNRLEGSFWFKECQEKALEIERKKTLAKLEAKSKKKATDMGCAKREEGTTTPKVPNGKFMQNSILYISHRVPYYLTPCIFQFHQLNENVVFRVETFSKHRAFEVE